MPRTASPSTSVVVCVWPRPSTNALQLAEERVGVGREAEQLRQLPDDDRDPEAVHVTDLHLFREQVGDEAELAEAEADLDQADEDREHARQDDRRPRVSDDQQGRDRSEDQGRDRGVGPEHEDPRRPEEGVADQAGDRRVEAGDGRQAGELRVGHPLGHQDRGEDDAGDQVGASGPAGVLLEELDPGHPAMQPAGAERGDRGFLSETALPLRFPGGAPRPLTALRSSRTRRSAQGASGSLRLHAAGVLNGIERRFLDQAG